MKMTICATLFAATCMGCSVNAGDRTVVRNRPTFGGEGLDELAAAVVRDTDEVAFSRPVELIAWAVKSSDSCPPLLVEEAIILVPLRGEDLLAMVIRRSGEKEE